MTLPPLSPEQEARYHEDQRPELHKSLAVFLLFNNVFVVLRCVARYRTTKGTIQRMAIEDLLIIFAGLAVDVVIANLWAATHYGLGLHAWRIVREDPNMPSNLSNVFKHVWISMVLMGPVFSLIKLTLLFFYRRLFLVHQRWLYIAWRINLVYVFLWLIGATGFYLFQCWPPQWYFRRYFERFGKLPKDAQIGQCNATTVEHVSMPCIFGLVSDVAILLLPVATLWNLQVSLQKKVGLTALFCVGVLACALDLGRIIELRINTDDKTDPSYGVVIFLVLTAASEVTAIVCICLPIVIPWLWREYDQQISTSQHASSSRNTFKSNSTLGDSSLSTPSIGNRLLNLHRTEGFQMLEPGVSSGTAIVASCPRNITKSDDSNVMVAGRGSGDIVPSTKAGVSAAGATDNIANVDRIRVETKVEIRYGRSE